MQRYAKIAAPVCPGCGGDMKKVVQGAPRYMNEEQFDSQKPGDYFCDRCRPVELRGKSGYLYRWSHELVIPDRRKHERRAAAMPIAMPVPSSAPFIVMGGKFADLMTGKPIQAFWLPEGHDPLPEGTKLYLHEEEE